MTIIVYFNMVVVVVALPNEDGISLCEKFADFFDCKIKKIIDTINSFTFNNNEIELSIEPISNLTLSKFNVPSRDTISRLILSFRKSSPHDPIPLSLFKLIAYPLSNYILTIIKLSFTKGSGEYINKHVIICPIIKDHNIDKNILGNYRPVSQITLISKLTENIVYKQIIKYIEENNLLDEFQSAYRALHSTETALINVMDDFLNFKDSNCPIQILLLDLSAAFDTLDHSILEKRLLGLGIEKLALNWIMSYIKERTFSVKISEHYSTPRFLNTGIPQGSVLGPLLFLIYIKPLSNIIKKFSGIKYHIYADDIIIYTALSNNSNNIFNELSPCANAINRWLIANKLLLNKSKTVLLNIPSNFRYFRPIIIDKTLVNPSNSVKYLGIIIDRELNMNEKITSVCRKTNSSLYRIRKIRKYLTKHITIILIKYLALSNLDYCSSIYHGLTHKATRNIHRIIRRSVRLIFRQRNTDHSSVTKRMQEVGILDIQK